MSVKRATPHARANKALALKSTLAAWIACTWMLPLAAQTPPTSWERYTIFVRDTRAGYIRVETTADRTIIHSEEKVNGRGPSLREMIRTDHNGLPMEWTIAGNTAFGGKVDDRFAIADGTATWSEPSGEGRTRLTEPSLYVAGTSSDWAYGLYARALLKDPDRELPALPGGTLRLGKVADLDFAGPAGARSTHATAYAVSGITQHPAYVILDDTGAMVARVTATAVTVREGLEAEAPRLFRLVETWSGERLANINKEVAHNYGRPVRIRNVRLFDPRSGKLTPARSVLVRHRTIAAVDRPDRAGAPGEVVIEGGGGTLVPGMYEMHTHVNAATALIQLMAGITTMRDMAGNNASVVDLARRIESGDLGGPRVIRNGMIEGKSPFNNAGGILVVKI